MKREEAYPLNKLNISGTLTIASRMRRLSDLLFAQVQELYDARGRNFKSSWFAMLVTIKREGQVDFKTLASHNNISSPAVSQSIRELEALKLVKIESGADKRSRIIHLTAEGHQALENIIPDLIDIEKILSSLMKPNDQLIVETLNQIEQTLRERPLAKILEFKIIPFEAKYSKDFERLNREWLEEYFTIEQADEELFANPTSIIDGGGQIFLASQNKKIRGTLALIAHDQSKIEISKMTVDKDYRRRGVAKLLLNQAIKFAEDNGYKEIFALTNSKLSPAIALYRANDFRVSQCQDPRYKRVNERYSRTLGS